MSINSKSTKAEILAFVEELNKQKAALESQVKQLQKNPQPAPASNSASTPATTTPKVIEPKPMNQTLKNDIEQTLLSLEKLQSGFGSAVSNLSEQLITEASTLEKVQSEVALQLEQLTTLHGLETIEENTLDSLIESYEESSKAFNEELSLETETLTQEIQELTKTWQKEQETHQTQLQERNQEYQQTLARETEEYEYNLTTSRLLSEDQHQQTKKSLYKELAETRQAQEKQWQDKEDSISQRELLYKEAKEKVEAFQREKEQVIEKGKGEGKGIGFYQAKVRADLRAKEVEGERKNYELRTAALEATIQTQELRLQSLTKQLESALKQVQDLAVKAIDGSSNRNSFEAMKEIAIEQAKNQQKLK